MMTGTAIYKLICWMHPQIFPNSELYDRSPILGSEWLVSSYPGFDQVLHEHKEANSGNWMEYSTFSTWTSNCSYSTIHLLVQRVTNVCSYNDHLALENGFCSRRDVSFFMSECKVTNGFVVKWFQPSTGVKGGKCSKIFTNVIHVGLLLWHL